VTTTKYVNGKYKKVYANSNNLSFDLKKNQKPTGEENIFAVSQEEIELIQQKLEEAQDLEVEDLQEKLEKAEAISQTPSSCCSFWGLDDPINDEVTQMD
jgi:hypothetical protein